MRTCDAVVVASLVGASCIALTLGERSASAAPNGFALNRFEPAERGSSWFVGDSLSFRELGRPAVGVLLDYQNQPLAIRDANGDVRTAVVGHVLTTRVGASIAFWERVRVGLSLPVILYTAGEAGALNGVTYAAPTNDQAIGDLRLGVDARLFGQPTGPLSMAFGARLWAPTGSTANFTGDGGLRAGPRVSAAGRYAFIAYGGSLGVTFRDPESTSFAGAPIDHDLPFTLSAGARLLKEKLLVGPEVFGTTVLNDAAFKTRTTPIELLLGGHYDIGGGFRTGVGVGTGLVSGFGAPQARFLGSLEWAPKTEPDRDGDGVPDASDACPSTKGVRSADPARDGCPPDNTVDSDGDGIPDSEDACVDVYGRARSDKRTNGCADRDFDGVPDPIDACPAVAGAAGDDPKTNGCPPPPGDRDKDGILDDVDACPDVAGMKDEDPELNGCPDPDPDHDGIGSDQDACPDVPGSPDPDKRKNGCPVAFIRRDEVILKTAVKFNPGSEVLVPRENEPVLQAIGELLKAHPEIVKLRIEAHTDNRGAPGANKKLSTLRATTILNWLAGHGVERSRLVAAGFGSEQPIETNDTPEGREANQRVELRVERAGGAAP